MTDHLVKDLNERIGELERLRDGWLWSYQNACQQIDKLTEQISNLQQGVKIHSSRVIKDH